MRTQPEALRLADEMEADGICMRAAAELRRLHAQRDALLEVVHVYQHAVESGMVDQDLRSAYELARAAIKAVEE